MSAYVIDYLKQMWVWEKKMLFFPDFIRLIVLIDSYEYEWEKNSLSYVLKHICFPKDRVLWVGLFRFG